MEDNVFGGKNVALGKQDGTTAGEARERMSEALFALSVFFGSLHFAGIFGQVAAMYLHSALRIDVSLPFKSTAVMGNLYLAVLTAYVGRKEYVRWFKTGDEETLPRSALLKMTRGEVIVVAWGAFTGFAAFLYGMEYLSEMPHQLLYTMGEVLALWCGSDALKFFKAKAAAASRETRSHLENYGDRVVALAKERPVDNDDCRREFGLDRNQAYRLLKRLAKAGRISKLAGTTKGTKYTAA